MIQNERRNLPIAVFDSGMGGISVLRELIRLMPEEDFYYRGDSLHAPYGTRSQEEILQLTLDNVALMAQKGIKGIVIACNTATSAAITPLRKKYTDLPIVGIEPAVKPAATQKEHARVLVMATPMTVKSEKFGRLLAKYEGQADITALGCPGMMEFVEAGNLDGPELLDYLKDLLAPYQAQNFDSIVLGCTHYPFLKKAIRQVVGDGPRLIDGSEGTAREFRRRMKQLDLATDRTTAGRVTFEESLEEKLDLCRYLLGQET